MNLVVLTHIYPANPLAPADIAGNFLPPFVHELARLGASVRVLAPQLDARDTPDPVAPVTRFAWWGDGRPLGSFRVGSPLDAARLCSFVSNGIRALDKLRTTERVDRVLACWAVPSGFIASFSRVPYAVWGLGTDIHTMAHHFLTRPFVTRALGHASLSYANSLTLVKQVGDLGFSCSLLPNLRPLLQNGSSADFPRDRFNFLCAARFEHVKGIDILLEAVANLRAPRPRVFLAGTGTLESELRGQAARLGLKDDVVFMGLLDEGGMASALAACDALVIPSRDESIPMIFKEAARFRVPVVATDVGDLRAFTAEYAAGIISPANDPHALARAMETMAAAPRETYRARLDELAGQFDLTRSAEKLLNDLERIPASRTHPDDRDMSSG
jgi:glycosyltransferase involved in cell wall biosynthesis